LSRTVYIFAIVSVSLGVVFVLKYDMLFYWSVISGILVLGHKRPFQQ